MRNWLLAGAAACAVMLAQADMAFAQQITGGIRGVVHGADGAPVAGASVKIISDSTGAALDTTTNEDGVFSTASLPVTGTYTVKVAASGYEAKTLKHISLSVSQTTSVDADLSATAAETVVVTGQRVKAPATAIVESRGVANTITAEDIQNTPTVTRDLKDILQKVPYVFVDPVGGGSSPPTATYSIGGANPRCTNLMVDGLQQKDNFGLNLGGYPTPLPPVPNNWISQTQIVLTPYDVQYNDACGGFVNVVTKDGGNEFHGEAYGNLRTDALNGKDLGKYNPATNSVDQSRPLKPYLDDKSYGFDIGGPILKDKLFFFVGYDEEKSTSSPGASAVGPNGSGYVNQAANISQADVNQVVNIAKTVYGFNAGDLGSNFTTYNQRLIGKLTWQINENQSLDFKYQRSAGDFLSINNGSSSDTLPRVNLPSTWYNNSQKMEVYTLQHTAHWTSDFSTEFSIGHESVRNFQTPLDGVNFPEVFVGTNDNGVPGYIALGPDIYRQYNYLYYKNDFAKGLATYAIDNHTIEGGIEFHRIGIDDKFVPGAQSVVRFDSINDFANGQISTVVNTATNGINSALSSIGGNPVYVAAGVNNGTLDNSGADGVFHFEILSFFVQDTWYPIDKLSIQYGVRYDRYFANDVSDSTTNKNAIVFNPYFKQRYGFANTRTVDGLDAILPRLSVSYNWDPDLGFMSGSLVTFRGGIGMYSSGVQTVWMTNNYDTTGINQLTASGIPGQGAFASVPTILPADHGAWLQALYSGPLSQASVLTTSTTDAQLPNFKLPKSLRENLGFDLGFGPGVLGDNWLFTFDYVNQADYDSPYWTNLRIEPVPNATAPDGRKLYQWTFDPSRPDPVTGGALFGTDIGMGSHDGGNTSLLIFQLASLWKDTGYGDFNLNLGYTHSQVSDVTAATSSTANSSYTNTARTNFNDPEVGTSDYERVHRATMNLSVTEHFFGDLATTLNVFGQRMSGQHYSLVFNGNPFGPSGGGLFGKSLVYIPKTDSSGNVTATSDPIVQYGAGFDFAGFNQMLHDMNLVKYAGHILPRNSQTGPWDTLVNLSLDQEIQGFDADHRLVVSMDIFNFLNMLNPKWGPLTEPNFYQAYPAITANTIAAGDTKYTYTGFNTAAQIRSNLTTQRSASTYQIQFGVRYEF
ncbi:MAG TPA: carboxypeptidase regulatory-like domain-containing protein [Rhizomicrobium sp.]|nr:carboxypeptidase regulatory-like domain-containing protein [Rhizomicrobium sp.]